MLPTPSAKEANQPRLPLNGVCADEAASVEGDAHSQGAK